MTNGSYFNALIEQTTRSTTITNRPWSTILARTEQDFSSERAAIIEQIRKKKNRKELSFPAAFDASAEKNRFSGLKGRPL